VFKIALL